MMGPRLDRLWIVVAKQVTSRGINLEDLTTIVIHTRDELANRRGIDCISRSAVGAFIGESSRCIAGMCFGISHR